MQHSERTRETRGRMARSPPRTAERGITWQAGPRGRAHALSSVGIGRVPGSERVPFDTRKSPPLVARSRGRHCGEHPVCCVETNGTTPVRSREASQVSEGRPPSVPRWEWSVPSRKNVLQTYNPIIGLRHPP